MSVWAEAKEALELNWREQWTDIAVGTSGDQPDEVHNLLLALSHAEKLDDRRAFLRLKAQLVSLPSWHGSRPISSDSLAVGFAKPTAAPIQLELLTS